MNILLLRGFNNYFNRKVKKYSTLEDYRTNSNAYMEFDNINFNPNDGVVTELIVGNENQKENAKPLDWENIGTPDYCICFDMVEDSSVIRSRWYVLESVRTRSGQYRIALKRDVIAEHFSTIINAPCFIEKGVINNIDNPLLFNRESMTYNQIKQNDEILLKDETGCGWIIGYVSPDKHRYPSEGYYSSTARVEGTGRIIKYEDITDPDILSFLSGDEFVFDYYQRISETITSSSEVMPISIEFNFKVNTSDTAISPVAHMVYSNFFPSDWTYPGAEFCSQTRINFTSTYLLSADAYSYTTHEVVNNVVIYNDVNLRYNPNPEFNNENNLDPITENQKIIEDIIYFIDNEYFKSNYFNTVLHKKYMSPTKINKMRRFMRQYDYIRRGDRLYQITTTEEVVNVASNPVFIDLKYNSLIETGVRLGNFVNQELNRASSILGYKAILRFTGTSRTKYFAAHGAGPSSTNNNTILRWAYTQYRIGKYMLTSVESTEIKTYIPAERQKCYDSSIDIFAIPYSDKFTFTNGDKTISMGKQIALQTAVALGSAGQYNVYDIQLLPYFPDRSLVSEYFIHDNQVDMTLLINHIDYETILDASDNPIGYYFWCRTNSGSFDITNKQISLSGNTAIDRKISNETELYRIVSPNYSGVFEFSLGKSNGIINVFNVDYTYKPFNPYIHITPGLTGLYGEQFLNIDDVRGLICGGDFSLTRYTDAWEQYQLNNKNYQEIFDRQIKNIDVNNAIAMGQQQISAGLGTAQGALGGLVGGAIAGAKAGPWGALAGAVIGGIAGGVTSGIAGQKDTEFLARAQQENRSYAIDMYGYQLGNIQALPYSLSKTSAFTYNNRIFPFVEHFKSTPEEVNILTKKIQYNGMTIMAIGKISDYITSDYFDTVFVKGQMIRLEDQSINDDFHIADAIYDEVSKGIYIPEGGLS